MDEHLLNAPSSEATDSEIYTAVRFLQFWNIAFPSVIPFAELLTGKRNSVSAVCENAVPPILARLLTSSNSTLDRFAQPENAPAPIVLMDSGSFILCMPELLNADESISSSLLPSSNVTVLSALVELNAEVIIVVIDLGNSIVSSEEHPPNIDEPIVSSAVFPLSSFLNVTVLSEVQYQKLLYPLSLVSPE